jgi:hypothetical protein
MISVRIDKDGFVRDFQRIIAGARRPRAVLAAAGRAGRNELVRHFRAKNRAEPNTLGGKRTHFWNAVARSTQAPVVDDGTNTVTITITDPRFAQKIFGGTITAKRARNLAIPQTPEAYGRSPRTFTAETGLALFFFRKNGGAFLAHTTNLADLTIHYILKPSVHQDPDPTALPDEAHLERVVLDAADAALQRQLHPPGGRN